MGLLTTLSIGAPPSLAGNLNGFIYGVNGIDRAFVRDPKNGLRNWGIVAPPAAPATAVGAAGVLTGNYYYKVTWENQNASIYGLYSATSTVVAPATQQVDVTRPSIAGIDAQVTHWILWRNTSGQTSTFYRVATIAIGTGTYSDNIADATIAQNETLEEHSPPEGWFRYVREFKGLLFLYGSRIEESGTVTVANGSGSVAGTSTQFTKEHEGQKIWFTGDSTVYTISAWTSATAITITPVKSGAVTGGTYKIYAETPSAMAVQRSDDESFEAASVWNVFPNDGDFPSGMDVVGGVLCLYKQHHVYGYEFGDDPLPTASAVVYPILNGRGLINEWCTVRDGNTAFNLDRQGVYQFDGSSQAAPIDQAIRRFFRPDLGIATEDRINWAYHAKFRATLDPVTRQAKWAVVTGSDTVPKTVLCYDIDRQMWTVDRDPAGVRAYAVDSDANSVYRAWKMSDFAAPGGPFAMGGTRQLDGTTSGTQSGTSTGSTANTLTDTGASFYTTGDALKEMTVAVLTTPPQIRVISSNTGTVLTVSENWTSNPPAGTTYKIGAVESRWRTPWIVFDDPLLRQQTQVLTLLFEPTAAEVIFYVRLFKDFESDPILTWMPASAKDQVEVPAGAATDGWIKISSKATNTFGDKTGGRAVIDLPLNAMRAFSVEIMQLEQNNPILFNEFILEGNPHGKSRRAE